MKLLHYFKRRRAEPAQVPAPARPEFTHAAAQEYEFQHASEWMRADGRETISEILAVRAADAPWLHPVLVDEFFGGDTARSRKFLEDLRDRTVLEIGCGPAPAVASIARHLRELVLLDPLMERYDALLRETHGDSWSAPNVRLLSQEAEALVPDLVGRVDGAIICRNALDHARDPFGVLRNLAAYAAPGCDFLLWTDLFHLDGHDEGHHDICRDPQEFEGFIKSLGFSILGRVPEKPDRRTIAYGCLARKG